jgi:hypothetical protein
MILRIVPYLLIIIPLIGFFFTPEPPGESSRQAISDLAYFLFTIPWWAKILSIVVGIFWISNDSKNKENVE